MSAGEKHEGEARGASDEARRGNPRLGAFVIALAVFLAAAVVVFAVYKLAVQRETRAPSPARQTR